MTTATKRISPCPTPFSDHIYKTEAGVEVPLRIWPATADSNGASNGDSRGAPASAGSPWLLWFHGGAFMAGKHWVPNAWVVPAFRARGYTVVSAAYRLTPHVDLCEILDDCSDALAWCRSNLPAHAPGVDVDALVVGGDSAGGTLSTLCGHLFSPRPRAVLDVFGLVDPAEPALQRHLSEERRADFAPSGKFTLHELRLALSEREPADAAVCAPWTWELDMPTADLASFWGTDFEVDREAAEMRMDMVRVAQRDNQLFRVLVRREMYASDQEFIEALQQLSSFHMLSKPPRGAVPCDKAKYVYPPTAFIHGEKDRTVSVKQSQKMAKQLAAMGVPVNEAYDPEGDHCFESQIECPEDAGWNEYIVPTMDFLDLHVKA